MPKTPFVRGENYQPAEIRVMWPGGPSRMWNPTPSGSAQQRYEAGGFAGSYVCQGCNQAVTGVYRQKIGAKAGKWLCGGCINP